MPEEERGNGGDTVKKRTKDMLVPALAFGGLGLGLLGLMLSSKTQGFSAHGGGSSTDIGTRRQPTGKGIFIRSVKHAGDNPSDLVRWVKSLNLSWVAILVVWQKDGKSKLFYPDELPAYCNALRQAGIKVWLWGWPEMSAVLRGAFVSHLVGAATKNSAEGIILNVEEPYYRKPGAREAAASLVKLLRKVYDRPIGFTSYGGGPSNHPHFPWVEFSQLDFGIPQIYDSKQALSKDFPTRSVDQWKKLYGSNLVVAWGASNRQTPDTMRSIISRTPLTPGVMWWDLYWATKSKARAEIIRNFKLGAVQVAA